MKITEIKIGDKLCDKIDKFPMYVVGIFECGTIYLDFEGNEGDVWEAEIETLERVL